MKIKSLLISAALLTGMTAAAQATISAPEFTINDENVGQFFAVPLTLNMSEGDNFTNCQVTVELPDGIVPFKVNVDDDENIIPDPGVDDTGFYSEAGADIKLVGRPKAPCVGYSDNFGVEGRTNYTIVGANLTKTANETNPNQFVTFYVNSTKVPNGASPLKVYAKFTRYDDTSFTVGEEDALVELDNVFNFDFKEDVAVEDVNSAKAVSSVKYYNAAGVAADAAFEGVNIVVTKYADGSQSVVKVVK
ncbi:MAG: hypothetical protein IJT30_09815 [Muribaculaceae bacterium]|nr:hypothetical protein [Muribaculaceae bacterium]